MRRLIIATLALAVSMPAMSHDLGVSGKVFPIEERNLVLYFLEKAAKVDWEEKQKELGNKVRDHVQDLPDQGMKKATETKTTYIDPSVVLQKDIKAPVQVSKEEWSWKVVARKGDRINPLESVQPPTRMLFFDPRDEEQKAFAFAALRAYPHRLMPVVTAGDVDKLSKEIGQPVYYAVDAIVKKFDLESVPSLGGTGKDDKATMLALTTFGEKDIREAENPAQLIRDAWYGLPEKKEESQ